ncbi:CaiB/BaiF CoA transferase family protein [Nocardia veterana]|uniref:CoA transferase n=1 Tax=Nocardia veterana TaxID=132249 RepID=A0A7X6LZU7_9NOCA|nr:CoA transferase [Nocardia veterana]NKY87690.1 CoA transferase [Nocardia veterana]
MSTRGPLHGIRVLDFGQYIAGPSAGQTLADLGADVVKVESLRGDQARGVGTFGRAMVQAYNRDKRSLAIDLARPEGKGVLHALLERADVLIQNFRADSAERMGLGAESLRAQYPRLIYAGITGFGTRGPSRRRPGLDIAAQAEFGLMHTTGPADGSPQRVGFAVADVSAANALAMGILAALYERHSTGRGAQVETSLMEAVLSMQAATWGEYQLTGIPLRRKGNGQANAAPAADLLEVADGAVVLSAYTDDKWAALCTLIDRPDMIEDPRFADNPARVRNRGELLAALNDAFAGMTREQATKLLQSAGIVCGAVRAFDEVAVDPDVSAAGVLVSVAGRDGGEITFPGCPFTIDGRRRTVSRPAPAVGEDSARILREVGYSDEDITVLVEAGVISALDHRPMERRYA